MKATILAATIALSSVSAAHADVVLNEFNTFVTSDFITESDNKVITEATTGLEFLSLDVTRGISVNEFNAQTGEGQKFEGYEFASYDLMQDVQKLMFSEQYNELMTQDAIDAGYVFSVSKDSSAQVKEKHNSLVSNFGSLAVSGGDRAYALFDGGEDFSKNLLFGIDLNTYNYTWINHYGNYGGDIYSDSYESVAYSLWVVSSDSVDAYYANKNASNVANVSSPLLGFGLIPLLAMLGFRKKA